MLHSDFYKYHYLHPLSYGPRTATASISFNSLEDLLLHNYVTQPILKWSIEARSMANCTAHFTYYKNVF